MPPPPPLPAVWPNWQYIFTKCVFSLTLLSLLAPFPSCRSEYEHIERGLYRLCKHCIPSLFFQYSFFFFFLHGLCFPLFSRRGPSPKSRSPSVACLSEACVPSVSSTVFVKALLSLSISTLYEHFSPFLPPLASLYLLSFTPALPPSLYSLYPQFTTLSFTFSLSPSPIPPLYRPPLYPLFIAFPYTPSLSPSPIPPLYRPPFTSLRRHPSPCGGTSAGAERPRAQTTQLMAGSNVSAKITGGINEAGREPPAPASSS